MLRDLFEMRLLCHLIGEFFRFVYRFYRFIFRAILHLPGLLRKMMHGLCTAGGYVREQLSASAQSTNTESIDADP